MTNKTTSKSWVLDVVLSYVIPYVDDLKERGALPVVCRCRYELDGLTRAQIMIALLYSTSPERLRRRFHHVESLKLKGKPRAAMFNLIPKDWGGYVTPWGQEIAESFHGLNFVAFEEDDKGL